MITVLLADDDPYKAAQVKDLCLRILGPYGITVDVAPGVTEALKAMAAIAYDLLVLDLNLPLRAGRPPGRDGGLHVLRALKRGRIAQPPAHVVGLSAFTDVIDESKAEFAAELWSLIPFDPSMTEWARALGAKLLHLSKATGDAPGYRTGLAIITALSRVELTKVLDLPGEWRQQTHDQDDTVYHRATWKTARGRLSVVAAASTEIGSVASTALAMKMIYRYRPRFICMTGIAAGASKSYHFGDVLVATQAFEHAAGKTIRRAGGESRFLPAPAPLRVHPWLMSRLQLFEMEPEISARLRAGWSGEMPAGGPLLRLGVVGSGPAVVADRTLVDDVQARNRELVGIEMEVFGVFMAAAVASGAKPKAFALKSVCDFGDSEKDDTFQKYAAHTSARCLFEFAAAHL